MTANASEIASNARFAISVSPEPSASRPKNRATASPTKTERFIELVVDRYGPLAQFQVGNVSRVCTELAPEVQLDPGAARTALRRHVLAAQNGSPS
jgi:hypothetical protein